jgi:uncharacterized damage-inducible protein DinB
MDPQALLPEFDQEIDATRRVLERVPEDRLDWRPHPRSWTLGELATHVAHLPAWGAFTLEHQELDLEGMPPTPARTSRQELLSLLDEMARQARGALEGASAEELERPWTLRMGEQEIFSLPKGVVYRTTVMNHLIHHRGQLTVYLRLLDVPLPGIYGPTADEPFPTG